MTGRKALLGLCMLCALMVSAVAAQSAMAVSGTTWFTCVKDAPSGTLFGAHCLSEGLPKEFKHVEVPQDQTTELSITNSNTGNSTTVAVPATLKETIAGVELEIQATGVTGTGSGANKKDATTGEHYISGTVFFETTGVTVTKPAGKGCKVFTDDPVTKAKGAEGQTDVHLDFTTLGQGDSINFTPAASTEGGNWATYYVECTTKVPAIEGTFPITGSATCAVSRATIECQHNQITEKNGLKGKGAKAGVAAVWTFRGRANISESFNPLSVTTVTT
jgi:hypothetical protein